MKTIFFLLRFVIFFLEDFFADGRPQCDYNYCNNEGECYMQSSRKLCQCVDGAYKGARCTESIDNCENNPCKNGGICRNIIGNYFCECKEEYSGQNCSVRNKKLFKNVHIHYNRVVELNKDINILILMEDIGSVQIALELYSSNHIFESVAFPRGGPKFFKKSTDFKSLCSKYGIRKSFNIPFKIGYYVVTTTTVTHIGHIALTLSLSDYEERDEYYWWKFYVFSYSHPGQCFPRVINAKCESPQKPLSVGIDQFNTFEPIVKRSCGVDSSLGYSWSLWNYLDTELFHRFEGEKAQVLTVPPRTLWFEDSNPFFQSFFVVKLIVDETSKNRRKTGKAIFRCYILVLLRPPQVVILGGNFREINAVKDVVIDASESKDENLPENSKKQKLKFTWNCESEATSKYCKKNIGQGPTLKIPGNTLQVGKKYNFTVEVWAHTTHETDKAWQEIIPVAQDRLTIAIICVRNCQRRLTNNQDVLHLKADCSDCKTESSLSYAWKVVSPEGDINQSTQRFILKGDALPKEAKILIQVEITQESKRGKSMIELEINHPPKGGKCSCNPSSGTEFDTIFLIECKDYEDVNEPIFYSFFYNDKILSRTSHKYIKTRLSAVEGGGKINIEICDCYHACTTSNVDVQVTEKVIPSTPKELRLFLETKSGNTSLASLLKSGDRLSAVVLINMASRVISKMDNNDEQIEMVNKILSMMQFFDMKTSIAAQQASMSLREVVLSVNMNYKIVASIGRILENLSDGLISMTKSGEIENMQWSECVATTQNLGETIAGMFVEIDKFPTVHNAMVLQESEDPFHENYPDYGELDFEIIKRISDWQVGSIAVQRLLFGLGAASSKLLKPGEPPMNLNIPDMNIRFLSVDRNMAADIKVSQWGNEVNLNPSFVQEVSKAKNSEHLGLQVVVMQNNPFWWYPDQFKINTPVISLSAFGDVVQEFNSDTNGVTLKNKFSVSMSVKSEDENIKLLNQETANSTELESNLTSTKSTTKEIIGYVNATMDMPTYAAEIPQNSLLVYDFTSLDGDVRVLVKIGRKPRYWMITKEYKVITKSLQPSKTSVLNQLGKDSTAYIAIIPHGNISQPRVSFGFKVTTFTCQTWDLINSNWSSEHCVVGSKTTFSQIHCECNHMSTFVSKLFITPNKLLLKRDVVLHLVLNMVFLGAMLLIILFFIGLLIWAWYKDKYSCRDVFVGSKTVKNSYKYVVTVSTADYPQSGTTANVTIQLQGDRGNSEEFLLSTGKCRTILEANTVYTFTLLTPNSLGKLKSITLSHDSAGRYPSWYCSIVRVKDVAALEEYVFLVQTWLSLVYNNSTKVNIPVATKTQLRKFKLLLREHVGSHFGDCYLCQLFCSTHTRSILNRKEKTMILLTAKSVYALVSIMLFGKTTLETIEDEQEEYDGIFITLRVLFVLVLAIIVASLLLHFITMCFIWAKTKKELQYELIYGE